MAKTPIYQRKAADRWRGKQVADGARRVEFLLSAEELQVLDTLAAQHGNRMAALRWLLQNANPAESKPAECQPIPADSLKPPRTAVERHVDTLSGKVMSSPSPTRKSPDKSAKGKGTRAGEAERSAQLAAQAQALREQGYSWQAIARQWKAEGVPSLRGGRWDASTVQHLTLRFQLNQQEQP